MALFARWVFEEKFHSDFQVRQPASLGHGFADEKAWPPNVVTTTPSVKRQRGAPSAGIFSVTNAFRNMTTASSAPRVSENSCANRRHDAAASLELSNSFNAL